MVIIKIWPQNLHTGHPQIYLIYWAHWIPKSKAFFFFPLIPFSLKDTTMNNFLIVNNCYTDLSWLIHSKSLIFWTFSLIMVSTTSRACTSITMRADKTWRPIFDSGWRTNSLKSSSWNFNYFIYLKNLLYEKTHITSFNSICGFTISYV